jgi:anti-sigma factor RsiW
MNKKQHTATVARRLKPCVCPKVGDLLPDYIVELLSTEAAKAVREHLLICDRCADDYTRILKIRAVAQQLLAAARGNHTSAPNNGGPVIRQISDHKRGRGGGNARH